MSRMIRASLFIAITMGLTIAAHAETVFLKDKPGNIIKVSEAAKSKVPVYECQKVKQGANINPVKVPGSTTVWSSNPGTGVEDVADLLGDGKTGYRCKTKQLDPSTGRMKAATL